MAQPERKTMTSLTHKTNPHMVVKQIMIMTAQAMTDSG
jgi:hypothetical protein